VEVLRRIQHAAQQCALYLDQLPKEN
jgi:hypothetical protein